MCYTFSEFFSSSSCAASAAVPDDTFLSLEGTSRRYPGPHPHRTETAAAEAGFAGRPWMRMMPASVSDCYDAAAARDARLHHRLRLPSLIRPPVPPPLPHHLPLLPPPLPRHPRSLPRPPSVLRSVSVACLRSVPSQICSLTVDAELCRCSMVLIPIEASPSSSYLVPRTKTNNLHASFI